MLKKKKSNLGGKRVGAGRPKIDPMDHKEPITCRLPYWLAMWLKGRKMGVSTTIQIALVNHFEITQPRKKRTKK